MQTTVKTETCLLILTLSLWTAGCIPVVPGDGPGWAGRPFGEHIPAKVKNYQILGAKVSPLLGKYFLENRSKCRFPYNDNEVEIEGFSEFAAQNGVSLKNGRIIDPWGDPVHLVIALEGKGEIRARGESYSSDSSPKAIHVGLLLDKPSHIDGLHLGPNLEWSVLRYQIK